MTVCILSSSTLIFFLYSSLSYELVEANDFLGSFPLSSDFISPCIYFSLSKSKQWVWRGVGSDCGCVGGLYVPFLPHKMGDDGSSKPRFYSYKHQEGLTEGKCKSGITIGLPCPPLLSKVPISKLHSGAQGITAVSIHSTKGKGQIAR